MWPAWNHSKSLKRPPKKHYADQQLMNSHCLLRNLDSKYIAFIDRDEYFFSPHMNASNMQGFLTRYLLKNMKFPVQQMLFDMVVFNVSTNATDASNKPLFTQWLWKRNETHPYSKSVAAVESTLEVHVQFVKFFPTSIMTMLHNNRLPFR